MEGRELNVVGLSVKLRRGGVVTVDLDCHLDNQAMAGFPGSIE